jgi:hypothetical protein
VSPTFNLKRSGALKLKGAGQVEQVEGNPFAELAARLTGVTERQLAWHTKASLPTHLKTSAGEVAWGWGEASLINEALHITLEPPSGGQKRAKRAKRAKNRAKSTQKRTKKRAKRLKKIKTRGEAR